MSFRSHIPAGAITAALIATVAAATAVVAQNQQPPAPPQPRFRTEANYVRVDVYPTKDGVPVTDLLQDDFEIVEDRAAQKIEQFEHVNIRGNLPQEVRVEPNTVAQSLQMVERSRARLFVVFLDTYHVTVDGSHSIRQPLITALDRLIGPDDLVGVMTPEMSANDVTFARKTTTIEGFLTRYWHWGQKDRAVVRDQADSDYGFCYPNRGDTDCAGQNGLAAQMIDRRHEKLSLDALEDVVLHLRGLREERKAIIAITNGWLLYRPDRTMRRPLTCSGRPPIPQVGVDSREGKLTSRQDPTVMSTNRCELDRIALSNIDHDQKFRNILNEANAANASFYPIDPRGLPVFDTPIMRLDVPGQPPPVVPVSADSSMLKARTDSLRVLAENTDGLAIVNSSNIDAGFKRIVADLSSYYLLGYYSSGKLDGRYHSITVRVKRPGVQVRARRGYLAASPQASTAAAATADAFAATTAATAEAHALDAVLAPLGGVARELPVRLSAAAGYTSSGLATIWVVGELGTGEEWRTGAEADVMLTNGSASGSTLASAHVTVPIGSRTFRATLAPSSLVTEGEYTVRVRARGAGSSMSTNEATPVLVSPMPTSTGAIYYRRGQSTGNREVVTADLRFRRSEQIRVEIPMPGDATVTARLLDRIGKALAVPVTASVRADADGTRWQAAQLALAPLAPGDYVVEIARTGEAGRVGTVTRTLVAFRVVP